jgi:thiol-disulfide isomerase/thioredoxin
MPRLWFILLAAILLAAGCSSTGKKPAAPTNGPNAPGSTPFWSEDKPAKTNGVGGGPKTEVEGLLAGMLIDNATGRPQPNALINVTAADGGPNAKPIGVQADDQGYFTIKGLKTGVTYQLSVRSDDHGKTLGGSVTTQAPNTRLLIRLSEGKAPPTQPNDPKTAPDKKESKTKLEPPPAFIPRPEPAPKDPLLEGTDNSWGPGKTPPTSRPLAAPPPPPTNNPNIADSNNRPWPPPASIAPPRDEAPPLPSSPSMSATPSNSSPLAAVTQVGPQRRINFTLYDAGGSPIEFRNLSNRRLIVLDFWATFCNPCLQKIPDLIELQNQYSAYVDVIGVDCDNHLPFAQRTKAVDNIVMGYKKKRVNYRTLFEGDGQETRVQSQFNVREFPTLVLLDFNGRELWRGSNVHALEDSIKFYLMRK